MRSKIRKHSTSAQITHKRARSTNEPPGSQPRRANMTGAGRQPPDPLSPVGGKPTETLLGPHRRIKLEGLHAVSMYPIACGNESLLITRHTNERHASDQPPIRAISNQGHAVGGRDKQLLQGSTEHTEPNAVTQCADQARGWPSATGPPIPGGG